MKQFIYIIIFSMLITSCEDVIEVDLDTAPPRLVIDASLSWERGTSGNEQVIKLSLTAPFFDTSIPPASGAIVTVTDTSNNTFIFNEEASTGIYRNTTFIPQINGEYTLTVVYNNEVYTATETLFSVVPIDFVEQKNGGGFSGDEIEIKAFYTDPGDKENYYLFEFQNNQNVPMLDVYDDEFTNGNQIFGFFSDDEMKADDILKIKISGVSRRCFEYINVLLQQIDDDAGDPFETQPATVRGNCVNQTNPDNFPLGYFRVTETDIFNYIVQ